ncbi:hypothetical protein K523DRAFT_369386 [Schizophyllum commune Tattone D]|nr:hypothetical protein K523DRAFT_369386 [Schizophyllum commune Tattone D]
MPSSKSDRTLSYAAREGGLMYYDMVADSEHLPPRRSPLQFVAKDRRPAVVERMLIIDDLVEGETAYSRGGDIFEQQISDAVERSKTLSRLSSHLKEAIIDAVTSREVVYEEVATHEPHPHTRKNRPTSLYEMIVATSLDPGGEAVLASWVTVNIVPVLEAAAVLAACRDAVMKTMADNLILPDDEDEDEDVLYVPKAYQPAYSAPSLQERVFIPRTRDNGWSAPRARPTRALPARPPTGPPEADIAVTTALLPVVESLAEEQSTSSGAEVAIVAPLPLATSLEPRVNPVMFFLASILAFLRLLVGW